MKVLDLYCGAGGLGFGFELTGAFKVVAGIDIYQPALDSFYQNHHCDSWVLSKYSTPTDLSDEETRKGLIYDFSDADVVVGGPPCQGFSVAGKRLDDYLHDERNHQVFNYLDIIEKIKPKAFVMENVRGITTTGQKDKLSILNQLIGKFDNLGYNVTWQVMNAEDFYVPQRRRRMFLVGVQKNLGKFKFPLPLCGKNDLFSELSDYVTVREAIGDLPYPNDGSFDEYDKNAGGWYQKFMRLESNGVQAHFITKHKPEFVERLQNQKLGDKLYPNWNHSWVKFHPDRIAPTIKENHRAPGVHYHRPMCISSRECARLQSMPDKFILSGTKSQTLVQVGNAVPPLLAAAVAKSLAEVFKINTNLIGPNIHQENKEAAEAESEGKYRNLDVQS
jgi:DNA (cytosine-5)-methyltransferase 1